MINILAWLLFGMAAGWMAARLFELAPGGGALLHVAAGAMGAVVGGVVFLIFDTAPLTGFSLWGVLCALLGAAITIMLARIVVGRTI
jgi:uncharacterized membrane protein YeaQ/YmgE (transglycosylase-associated protein family)